MGYIMPAFILQAGILLLFGINSSASSIEPKGFGFQKEHDGSIIGMEDGVQQIAIAGTITYIFEFHISLFRTPQITLK